MAKKAVNAKEILVDIKAGMDDSRLMEKYKLSEKGLQSLFRKLVDAGLLKQEESENRAAEAEKDIEYAWKCSQCGNTGTKSFDQCPECHVFGSRIKIPKDSEQTEEIKETETQAKRHPVSLRKIKTSLGTVLGNLSKSHFHILGSIGALVLLFIAIVLLRALYPVQVLPTEVKQKLVAHFRDQLKSELKQARFHEKYYYTDAEAAEIIDKFFGIEVTKAEKGVPTQVIRNEKNPKEIYCIRLTLYGAGLSRRPSAFNVLVYQLQSGELEITPIDIETWYRGYNDCPKDWGNICPFGCADSNREIQNLRKRLDEFVQAAHEGNLTKVRQLVAEGVDVVVFHIKRTDFF